MPTKTYKPVIISLILLSTLPFLTLFKGFDFGLYSSDSQLFYLKFSLSLGNILGFIGSVLLFWELILGIRFLANLLTPDLPWLTKVHSWLGKYGTVLILAHPILEMYAYLQNWTWIFIPDISTNLDTRITFGRIAFILILIIYITSIFIRGLIKYRPWKYVHYLSYPLMFLVFVHALQLGSFLNEYVALKAFWLTMLALYFILLVIRLTDFSGILKPRYKLINKYNQTSDLVILVFRPINKVLKPKPGQYFYLQIDNFSESHPFSLMEYNAETGDLMFGIKTLGKYTKKLNELPLFSEIKIEGAYGVFTMEAQNKLPKVIIAGGIGVTPFIELVKYYADENTIFLHANRFSSEIIAQTALQGILSDRYYDFISQNSEPPNHTNQVNSRIKPEHISTILGTENLEYYNYFICGSPVFIEGIQKILHNLHIPKHKIHIEGFTF